jgi:hypothetical protein
MNQFVYKHIYIDENLKGVFFPSFMIINSLVNTPIRDVIDDRMRILHFCPNLLIVHFDKAFIQPEEKAAFLKRGIDLEITGDKSKKKHYSFFGYSASQIKKGVCVMCEGSPEDVLKILGISTCHSL